MNDLVKLPEQNWEQEAISLEAESRVASNASDAEAERYPVAVVCAVIEQDGKFLLERRAPTGTLGLDWMWDLPGGKVEKGELPADALVREIREELGLTINVTPLPLSDISAWTYADGKTRHWILLPFASRIVSGSLVLSDNLRWFKPDEINEANVLAADLRILRAIADTQIEKKEEILNV
jgi:8-oxo-dGTP diphosphatase